MLISETSNQMENIDFLCNYDFTMIIKFQNNLNTYPYNGNIILNSNSVEQFWKFGKIEQEFKFKNPVITE